MNYQPMSLEPSYGFVARRLAEHPHVAVLTAPSQSTGIQSLVAFYHNVLKQMVTSGVRHVVVDVSGVQNPQNKLLYAHFRPCPCEDHKGPELMPVVGVTQEDLDRLHERDTTELAAKRPKLSEVSGFATTLDDAVAECLH